MLDASWGLAVFTDGSAYHRDRTGGWAWVAVDIHGDTRMASGYVSNTTISRMELQAPTEALVALAADYGPSWVAVYSDSEYVVLGCNDRTRKRNKNKRWWAALDDAITEHDYVEFIHVKGHADNMYNELADVLAGEARRNGTH